MHDVVITGLGLVCPLGVGVETVWRRLLAGRSGIGPIRLFNGDTLPCRIAGQVPFGPEPGTTALPRFIQLALLAAQEALDDAGWHPRCEEDAVATGLCLGSGCGGLEEVQEAAMRVLATGADSAGLLEGALIPQAARAIAQRFHLAGPRRMVSTACASGVHAIGDAARMIRFGDAKVMVTGGTEAAICEIGLAGFCAARALSTGFNDTPAQASRPWDRDRDGFIMGEGAGILVLEDEAHARARGARILGRVAGYGMSGDAHHITAPADGHAGAERSMRAALRSARMAAEDVQYVNAHGTSTPLGDDLELEAVERVFADAAGRLAMSSTKSATGHLLGAAGAAEAIFSALAIRDGVAPPTLNLDRPSRASRIDRVARVAQERPITAAMSNSFGFGGTNATLILRAA